MAHFRGFARGWKILIAKFRTLTRGADAWKNININFHAWAHKFSGVFFWERVGRVVFLLSETRFVIY